MQHTPIFRRAIEISVRCLDNAAIGRAAVGAPALGTETVQGCESAAWSNFEDRPVSKCATVLGGADKFPAGRLDKRGGGAGAVRSVEAMERVEGLRGKAQCACCA